MVASSQSGVGKVIRGAKSGIADRGVRTLDDIMLKKNRAMDATRRRNDVLKGKPKSKVKAANSNVSAGVPGLFDNVPAPLADVVKHFSPSTYNAIAKYSNNLLAGLGNKTASAKIVNQMRVDLSKRGIHSDDIDKIVKHLLSKKAKGGVTKGDVAAATLGGSAGAMFNSADARHDRQKRFPNKSLRQTLLGDK